MVLVKWLIIKSGAIQKRGLFITLVFVGALMIIPILATLFLTKSSINLEIPWSLSILLVIWICFLLQVY